MRRGDLVTVALPGDFGKPRPALIIQSDQFDSTGSVTVLLVSGALVDAPLIRLIVQPTEANGLRKPSQIMIDKAMTIRRDKLAAPFGRIDDETIVSINRSLALFLGSLRCVNRIHLPAQEPPPSPPPLRGRGGHRRRGSCLRKARLRGFEARRLPPRKEDATPPSTWPSASRG